MVTLQCALLLATSGLFALTSAQRRLTRTEQENYLKRFQHLGDMNPDPRMAELRSDPDAQFRMAISSFQRFAGLNITGQPDSATIRMMQMPRCGVPDIQNNMGGVARRRKRRYTTFDDKIWSKTALTYRFYDNGGALKAYTRDISQDRTRREISNALQLWTDVSPLTFNEVSSQSDIEISFAAANDHGDNGPFDNQGGTLAHAYFPGLGIGGDVHFDDSEDFSVNSQQGTNLLQVATHELGHSLGLGHSENQDAIMAPFYRGYKPNLRLHQDDIDGIVYLYGPKPVGTMSPPRITTPKPPSTRPTSSSGDTVASFCRTPVFDAIDIINGTIHAFYGDKYFQLTDEGQVRPGFPKLISRTFPRLPSNIDAVLSLEHLPGGKVFFFKGPSFYVYDKTRPHLNLTPFPINQTFSRDLSSVDAAFIWSGNGQIYFIKGRDTYRYFNYNNRGYTYSARPLSEWKDLPSTISDAFYHKPSGKTYFFSGKKYYIFNDRYFKVESVEDTYDWLHCCSIRVKELEALMQLRGSANAQPVLSTFLLAIGSLLALLPTVLH